MKLSNITEARYSGSQIETKYALFHQRLGRYYQYSGTAKQGFRLKGSFKSGISWFDSPKEAERELKGLQERLENRLKRGTGPVERYAPERRELTAATTNKINTILNELDQFQVIEIKSFAP